MSTEHSGSQTRGIRLSKVRSRPGSVVRYIVVHTFPLALLLGMITAVIAAVILLWHHHFWYALLSVYGYSGAAFLTILLVESVEHRRSERRTSADDKNVQSVVPEPELDGEPPNLPALLGQDRVLVDPDHQTPVRETA
jgi:hypothetical protein